MSKWCLESMAAARAPAPPSSMVTRCWPLLKAAPSSGFAWAPAVAEENLRALLAEVYAQAGVTRVGAASVGVASATMPGVPEWITAVFRGLRRGSIEVVGDEVIALDAAFRGGPGILQIAGTGTNSIGRAPDGGRETAGGWSSRLGDEGSGYWIGLHAIRRALNALRSREPTKILDVVGCDLGYRHPRRIGEPRRQHARAGFRRARSGHQPASPKRAIRSRWASFTRPPRTWSISSCWSAPSFARKHNVSVEVPVAWIGSVIGKSRLVREAFFAGLRAAVPDLPIRTTEVAGHRRRRLARPAPRRRPLVPLFQHKCAVPRPCAFFLAQGRETSTVFAYGARTPPTTDPASFPVASTATKSALPPTAQRACPRR